MIGTPRQNYGCYGFGPSFGFSGGRAGLNFQNLGLEPAAFRL